MLGFIKRLLRSQPETPLAAVLLEHVFAEWDLYAPNGSLVGRTTSVFLLAHFRAPVLSTPAVYRGGVVSIKTPVCENHKMLKYVGTRWFTAKEARVLGGHDGKN